MTEDTLGNSSLFSGEILLYAAPCCMGGRLHLDPDLYCEAERLKLDQRTVVLRL